MRLPVPPPAHEIEKGHLKAVIDGGRDLESSTLLHHAPFYTTRFLRKRLQTGNSEFSK
jgi:hypothetical protein